VRVESRDIAHAGMPLPAFPETVRVWRDGGLLCHLTVWENLSLPLEYHALDCRHVAEDAALLFALCGEDLAGLRGKFPDSLSDYEKRLVGFVRALLLEPEVLVLNDVYDGLTVSEKAKALQWGNVFHLRFPFRVCMNESSAGELESIA
jgi:ABC-type nitrate/sulfonate/bicarbonate transport system ATPase subunit